MRTIPLAILAALATACGKQSATTAPLPASTSPSATPTTGATAANHPQGPVTYRCDGGSQIQANYGATSVSIRWNGRAYPLTVDPSGGGSLYRNESFEWRLDGRRASLIERGRAVASGCEPA